MTSEWSFCFCRLVSSQFFLSGWFPFLLRYDQVLFVFLSYHVPVVFVGLCLHIHLCFFCGFNLSHSPPAQQINFSYRYSQISWLFWRRLSCRFAIFSSIFGFDNVFLLFFRRTSKSCRGFAALHSLKSMKPILIPQMILLVILLMTPLMPNALSCFIFIICWFIKFKLTAYHGLVHSP